MRWLRCGMNDQVWPDLPYKSQYSITVPNIESRMPVSGNLPTQTLQHPARIAFRPEKNGPMITVDTYNMETLSCEEHSDL
jgi:hypothetical protein